MEAPKPTPSRVEGKKEGHSKVLLTVEGDVDLRIPKCKYSWQHLASHYWLTGWIKEGGLLEPNTSTLGLWGLRWYFHFVAYILGYNVNHELQVFREGGNKGKIICIPSTLAIFVRSPECFNSTRRSLTSKQGREYRCLFTPLPGVVLDTIGI